nr:hypothetical protein [[Eubacterium] cellulosolvens]
MNSKKERKEQKYTLLREPEVEEGSCLYKKKREGGYKVKLTEYT